MQNFVEHYAVLFHGLISEKGQFHRQFFLNKNAVENIHSCISFFLYIIFICRSKTLKQKAVSNG